MRSRRDRTATEHARRIRKAMAHMAEHLDEALTLERLAAVACFSPFHFHRVYRALTGETPADTQRRLRLQRAAYALGASALPVSRIARQVGYGSAEALTRAFDADHGCTPGAFRRRQRRAVAPATTWETPMDHEIAVEPFSGATLAALPHRGDYRAIAPRFEQLTAWAAANGLMESPRRWFARFHDDPASVPVDALRSEACVEVDATMPLDAGMARVVLPAGRVARLVHRGSYAELPGVWNRLYAWLAASGHEPADQPAFEEYLNNPREVPPAEWLTAVCVPLRD